MFLPLHFLHLARPRHSSRRWPEQILRDVEESKLQQIAQALDASTSWKEKHVIFRNSGFFMWWSHDVGFVRFCHSTFGKNPFSQPGCVADGSAAIGGFAGEASEEPSEPRSRGLRRLTESLTERIFLTEHFVWHFVFCHSIMFYNIYVDLFWCWFDAKICKGVKPEKDHVQIVFAAISRSMILEMFFSASLGRSEQGVWSRQDTILRGVQGSNLSMAWQGYRTDETTMKKRPSFTSFFTSLQLYMTLEYFSWFKDQLFCWKLYWVLDCPSAILLCGLRRDVLA